MIDALLPAHYVTTSSALRDLMHELQQQPLVAVDTESNSYYAYVTRVCLVQLSTPTQDYILDPFAIDDMQPFGDLLANPQVEKVFHAAEYDLICLRRDFGFAAANLFDTMLAARLCGEQTFGLNDILKRHFGVTLDKTHQLDDWGVRPLSAESLRYAQMDTHYLPALRQIYYDKLAELGALDEAREVFEDALRVEIKPNTFDPDGFWKLIRPKELKGQPLAVLSALYALRERVAMATNLPPHRVIENHTLVRMAAHPPLGMRDLWQLRGVNMTALKPYAQELLETVRAAQKAPIPTMPEPKRVDPVLSDRYIALHAWRKEKGIARGLDSNIIVSKQTLWEIARLMPQTHEELAQVVGMGAWRLQAYGDEILALVRTL